MKFRFLGAKDGHVTGSCTEFYYERTNIRFLVDCGMIQGEGNDEADNSKPFQFLPSEINFVLLTHAHIDHCGLIPRLYNEGFSGKVICTRATARLAKISLLDCAKHSKGLYSDEDVKRIRFEFIEDKTNFGFARMLPIRSDLFVSFSRTAHILGSVSLSIGWLDENDVQRSMVMSGDIGNNTKQNPYQPLLANLQDVKGYPEAIVVESTYGGRTRESNYSNFEGRIAALRQIVQEEVFEKKGVLVIPAFSLQRTQEILMDLFVLFKNHFSTEESSQAQLCIPNALHGDLIENSWSNVLHSSLMAAVHAFPEEEKNKWIDSVQKSESNNLYFLKADSKITIDDVKALIESTHHTYPVDIVLDSKLAREMGSVFRDELCTRQIRNPDETVHRNRMMMERLGVSDEFEVDSIIKSIFPDSGDDSTEVSLGIHKIQYKSEFNIPGFRATRERGCILLTGGGMCEGGPVVKHIAKLCGSKQHSALLVTGYMAKGSLGARLVELGSHASKGFPLAFDKLNICDSEIPVQDFKTKIIEFQSYYSGHADENGLLDFIFNRFGDLKEGQSGNPSIVFINHGQHTARNKLRESIQNRASRREEGDREISGIELPDGSNQWFDLSEKVWVIPEPESKSDMLLRELLAEQKKTNHLLLRLLQQRPINSEYTMNPQYTAKKKASGTQK